MRIWFKRLLLVGVLSVSGIGLAQADRDEYYFGGIDVNPVKNELYKDECGACHFAYQPGLLPARSWHKLMAGLDDHFGENAELDEEDRQILLSYLEENSADHASARLSRKVRRYFRGDKTVIKISKIGFIAHEHSEIPSRVFTSKLRGVTNCNDCHERASEGSYRESEIRIPGYGRWDD